MECVILGAGGMMPMPLRLTTSMLLRNEGRMIMFDAGEGIQLALKRGGLGIRSLDAVFVSHLHADHVLGLPGVMMFRAQCDDPGPLTIVGPPGLKRFVMHTLEDLQYRIDYDLKFVEWSPSAPDEALRWHGSTIRWIPLEHSTFCLGYRLEEAPRPGKFDPAKAAKLRIPPGPLFAKLQGGDTVTLPSGDRISPDQVLGPKRRGRIVTFATDTRPCDGLARLCRNADLACVEGMFADHHTEEAAKKMHMTASQAAKIAADAGAQRLILVHISPRYTSEDERLLRDQARTVFPTAQIGRGLDTHDIPLPD